MAHRSDPALLLLLALRLRSFAPVDVLVGPSGLPDHVVATMLDLYAGDGLVRYREGRLSGWSLTAEGRKEGERLLAEELDALGLRGSVRSVYERFLLDNPALLELCTEWQMRPVSEGEPVLNTHDDPEYDRSVIGQLVALHDRARPIWHELASDLLRFETYAPRFEHAVVRVVEGEHDWFTKPSIDSFHTVWFELHEHLLATLGIERSSEGATS